MDGHSLKTKPLPPRYKGNVRTEQTACTRTVRTQDMEMTAGLFCGSPSHHLNLTIQHKKKKGQIYIHPFPKNLDVTVHSVISNPRLLLIKRILPSQLHTDHPIHFPNLLQVPPNIIAYLPDLLFFKGGFLRSFPFSLKQSQNLLTL